MEEIPTRSTVQGKQILTNSDGSQRITEETHDILPRHEPEIGGSINENQQDVDIPEDVLNHPSLAPAAKLKNGKNVPAIPAKHWHCWLPIAARACCPATGPKCRSQIDS